MGFFDKLSSFLSDATEAIGNSARRSDNPDVVMNYLNLFDQRVAQGNLEQLERMLDQREYEVRLDSQNDYRRRQKIEERLVVLRQVKEQEILAARKSFNEWLSQSGFEELEKGFSTKKYQIPYDSSQDSHRRARLVGKLCPMAQKSFDEWLSLSGSEELEKGLSTGRYQIPYDHDKDTLRRTQLEEKLRSLQEEQKQQQIHQTAFLFQAYLDRLECELYRSFNALRDFQQELSYLPDYQQAILDMRYKENVDALMSMPENDRDELLSNYVWQVSKQKTVAGKSLILLLLAARTAKGELGDAIRQAIGQAEDAVVRNSCVSNLGDEDQGLTAQALTQKGQELLKAGQPELAVACFYSAAEHGEADAQFYLGYCFAQGYGFSRSERQAFRWYKQSAQQHNALGLLGLGWCYQSGTGIEKDADRALDYFRESQSLGCAEASDELGNMAESCGDSAAAFLLYQEAAHKGSLSGKIHYFECLYYGKGTDKAQNTALAELKELLDLVQEDSILDQPAAGSVLNYIANMLEDEDLVHAYYSYDMNS